MRIGLVIYGSLATLSGGYLYDRQLVARLRAAGDEVEIISRPWRNYARHLADNLAPDWTAQLRAPGCDLLVQDELNHPSLAWANRRRAGGPPIVSIVHHLRLSERHPAALRPLYRLVERAYLRTVDGFIFNSQTTRAAVEALIGPAPRAVVAPPAGDRLAPLPTPAEIEARARRPGPLRLAGLGNVIERKGWHTVLDGLALLPGRDWQLTIAGRLNVEPAYTQRLRRQIALLGLQTRVALPGALDDDQLRRLLAASDALVGPSSYEGFGIAYLEGMGFGLPALASTAGAAHEIITPGRTGWLVPPDDARAIAQALAPLAADRAALAELSAAARRHYEAQPTWAHSMDRARAFLQALAGGQQ